MSAALAVACLGLAGLLAFLGLECLIGSARPVTTDPQSDAPSFIVLMPAHNEAAGIARSVCSVKAQLRPYDSLVVVADNCCDDTAAIARSLEALVMERFDPDRRGKGYALEFGRASLQGTSGEVVIVVDADCIPQDNALVRLAATIAARNSVIQGADLLVPAVESSTNVRISCFAFMIKNLVRQQALTMLSGTALIQGTGMGFPREVFNRLQWKTASLVEDLDMGLDLILAGHRIGFEPSAVFLSDASSDTGTASQRRRWEHGMLHSLTAYVPALLHKAFTGRWRLVFVGLDLMIPPTAMLIVISLATLAAGLLVLGLTFPVFALSSGLALLCLGLQRAWQAHGREILPLRSIAGIPAYIVWKLPIATQFFTRRERKWIRTERGS